MDEFVREIVAQRPDFVVNTLNGDSNLYFFRALGKAGVRAEDIPVFSTSIAEAELAAMGPELMTGHYAAWNYFQSVQTDANRVFVESFRSRFGRERVLDDPMEAAYIGVNLWVNALRRAGTLDMATIISLARNFRLNVIAEGVETQAQLAFLKQNECMSFQGYLFGQPVPLAEFEELARRLNG